MWDAEPIGDLISHEPFGKIKCHTVRLSNRRMIADMPEWCNSSTCDIAIRYHPDNIQFVQYPSINLQRVAVAITGCTIRYLLNPTEEIQLIALRQDPRAAKYITNPTVRVQMMLAWKYAMRVHNGYDFIDNPCIAARVCANIVDITAYSFAVTGYALGAYNIYKYRTSRPVRIF